MQITTTKTTTTTTAVKLQSTLTDESGKVFATIDATTETATEEVELLTEEE